MFLYHKKLLLKISDDVIACDLSFEPPPPPPIKNPGYTHACYPYTSIQFVFLFLKVRQMLLMFCAKPHYERRKAYESIMEPTRSEKSENQHVQF